MKHLSNILVLGDSILKGTQLDPESQKLLHQERHRYRRHQRPFRSHDPQ